MPFRLNPFTGMFDETGTGGSGGSAVTAASNLADNSVIRGDGGLKGVQDSGVTLDDSDNMSGINDLTAQTGTFMSLTMDRIVLSGVSGLLQTPIALTNGQLLIGSTGASPAAGSLTAPAAGFTITGGSGTITFALSDDLSALEGLATTGLAVRSGVSTWVTRTATAGSTKISITNGDGVAGNPTIDAVEANFTLNNIGGTLGETKGGTGQSTYSTGDTLYASAANTLSKLTIGSTGNVLTVVGGVPTWQPLGTSSSLTANRIVMTTTGGVLQTPSALTDGQLYIGSTGIQPVAATLSQPAAGLTITGGAGTITFALANDLSALEALSTTGLSARTGTSTWATRTLQQPAAGITITNGDGVAGDPTFALANDLSAVEGLSTNGIATRTATSTWTTRTITGTSNQITVSNGDGVSGNPTISLPTNIYVSGISFNSGTDIMDAYDEGTFTPTLTAAVSNPTVTYSQQVGRYTLIGNRISCDVRIATATQTGGSGAAQVSGFPFATVNVTNYFPKGIILFSGQDFTASWVVGQISANSTTGIFVEVKDNAGVGNTDISGFTAGDALDFCINYEVA